MFLWGECGLYSGGFGRYAGPLGEGLNSGLGCRLQGLRSRAQKATDFGLLQDLGLRVLWVIVGHKP